MVSISSAVGKALEDTPLLSRDGAAVQLVKRYALAIDYTNDPEILGDLGPKLLRALESLGMTPAGRGVKGGQSDAPVASKLDELRARREARRNTG